MKGFRWVISGIYVLAVILTVASTLAPDGDHGSHFSLTLLSLTVSYGILMFLIWLYERFPPPTKS